MGRRLHQNTSASWLATLTDLSALLVAFFVLTFSMSVVPRQEWQSTFSLLQTAAPVDGRDLSETTDETHHADSAPLSNRPADAYLIAVLERRLREFGLSDHTSLDRRGRGIELLVDQMVLEVDDHRVLADFAEGLISEVVAIARSTARRIVVLGVQPPDKTLEHTLRSADPILSFLDSLAVERSVIVVDGDTHAVGLRLEGG